MRDETKRNLRVGLLTIAALVVLGGTILMIGDRQQLFVRHTRYHTTFRNVTGLQQGAPVKLNGVTVGFVEDIVLPTDPAEQRIIVRFTLNAGYTERIRTDTEVSIKTIGLLGDKYLEIRGGSASQERVLEGGTVTGKDPAEVAAFVESGEDLMENLLAISSSLKNILRRVEAGEGLLGEMTIAPHTGERLSDTLNTTLIAMRSILNRMDSGKGLLGALLRNDEAARSLLEDAQASASLIRELTTTVTDDLRRDGTMYSSLMRDDDGATLMRNGLVAVRDASEALAAAVEELATGEGTLPRLMQDRDFAESFLDDLDGLIHNLRSAAEKLDQGQGTAGALINDPQMYEDLENVVRGVKSSKVVSWFIRNRRKKGEKIEQRELLQADGHATPEGPGAG
jgi:phospholipid/cholesterol/gamma-HCH transport system substrate-binding protein